LFCDAINACHDITATKFPHLYLNKKGSKTSGNISKFTRQGIRRLMIFIAWLYQAQFILEWLGVLAIMPPVPFSFKTYPILKSMFICIEAQIKNTQITSDQQSKSLTELQWILSIVRR
jgi:hypothetical protein